MEDPEPLQLLHVSTSAFPAAKRLATWREIYGRGICNVDIEPIGDTPFHADATFCLLPNIGIVSGSRSPARYLTTREFAAKSKDLVGIPILRSGQSRTTQFGREIVSDAGSATFFSLTDPWTATLSSTESYTTLVLSRPMIAALVPRFSERFARPIPSANPALRLLIRYLDLVKSGDELLDLEIGRLVSNHIVDLAALVLGAGGDVAEIAKQRGGRAARLRVIKADILDALGRGDLSTGLIAARHGISSRYVRRLFELEGTSFTAFVLAERVTKAHRMLVDRRFDHLNISQIAHESGFGDVSYFNRVFRRHFGAPPSDFRETAARTWNE